MLADFEQIAKQRGQLQRQYLISRYASKWQITRSEARRLFALWVAEYQDGWEKPDNPSSHPIEGGNAA